MLVLTILGLVGCAMALVALALDWRDDEPGVTGWTYTSTRKLE